MPNKPQQPSTRRGATLLATDIPGVWKNRSGVLVDADGVAIGFKDLKRQDDKRFEEVLGRPATQPLDIIEGVAMDPRQPLHARLDAAKHAAPYRHPKLIAMQGVTGAPPINVNWEGKTDAELADIRRRLEELALLAGSK